MRAIFLFATISTCAAPAFAQQPQSSPAPSDEVIRINTALVQTDVTVFDRRGTFVEDLKREQFVLKVDGKPREISFFEKVKAGSRSEEAQLAAARGNAISDKSGASPVPLDRGRTIFFFVDDLHVSAGNIVKVRESLKRFFDRLGQNDEAAVLTTTGQVGFLQQLTDNKAVLRAAVERLSPRLQTIRDGESPPMSQYQALLVDRSDNDVLDYFIDELLKQNPGLPRQIAGDMVRTRASQILQQSAMITTRTLATLERYVKTMAHLPGRKLVLFMSDGFLLDNRNSDAFERMRKITSAAAAAGVIIYSLDSRGLVASLTDASEPIPFDPSGRLERASHGESGATEDGLNALAHDTGGRAFFNSNALDSAVATAVKESSVYYLLAWRPENEEQSSQKFRRIEVSVVGRPELLVRFRRGFGEIEAPEGAAVSKKKPSPTPKTPIQELRGVLTASYPVNTLPISMTLNFLNIPQRGLVLATSLKIMTDRVVLEPVGGTPTAYIDVTGVILDDSGKAVATFEDRLTITSKTPGVKPTPLDSLGYNHFSSIRPGIYQVRVAARDVKQERVGSGFQWIEIPDLESKTLALSTLIAAEKKADADDHSQIDPAGYQQNPLGQVRLNVDHRFVRSSRLRFLMFVYNALTNRGLAANSQPPSTDNGAIIPTNSAGTTPDLAVQVQVFRDNEPVITDPLRKLSTEGVGDLARVPYAAELILSSLPPGRYVLQVTVIDRLAKTSAAQRFNFEVE